MAASIGITGLGIICAIGNNAGEVRDALLRKESGIGPIRYLPSLHTELPVGEIKMSTAEMMEMLGVDEPLASRTALMGAIAVKEALADAGIRDVSGKRVALISGTTVGVMDVTEVQFEKLGGMDPGIPRGNECGKSTQDTARYAGLESASCCTISTACSSALNALMIGAEMLLRDEVNLVVAGGTEGLSKFHLNGFNSLMILDHERCRPFDDTRAGLNLGEGAAYVVLEKNAPGAMAYIAGYANRCDAFHQTATSADGDGAFLAMTGALATLSTAFSANRSRRCPPPSPIRAIRPPLPDRSRRSSACWRCAAASRPPRWDGPRPFRAAPFRPRAIRASVWRT